MSLKGSSIMPVFAVDDPVRVTAFHRVMLGEGNTIAISTDITEILSKAA